MTKFRKWLRWKFIWWQFKRERRKLEIYLWMYGTRGKYEQICLENELFGIWKRI